MATETTNFGLVMPDGTDPVDVSAFNEDLETIDAEMAKPPLTVNGNQPDSERNIQINTVPLADNLVSDESQIATGAFVLRSSGGDASIANGLANVSVISGNAVKTGYVEQVINLSVVPISDSGISATVDEETLVSYMATSGTVTFTYSSSWSPSVSNYGITVTGTPDAGDQIILNYTKGNRGTIAIPNPVKLISTGWNLYNNTNGFAMCPRYSDTYGYMISGSYSAVEFSATQTGSRQTIVPVSGHFTVPSDGYVFVTGGNATNTAIYMTWSDWTDGTPESFAPYSQTEVDLSGVMVNFPNGLMRVGTTADEINFNTQTAVSRIARIAYTAENLESIIESGLPYDTDQNYIYHVRSEAITYSIDLDGEYTANDHGTELFTGTNIPTYATILYGQDLAGKLRRDVVTISPMDLTDTQKAQVRESIGAADSGILNGAFKIESYNYVLPSDIQPMGTMIINDENMHVVPIAGYSLIGVIRYDIGHKGLALTGCSANGAGKLYVTLTNRLTSIAGYNSNFGVQCLWVRSELLS
ncbi:MAG: hypothetical protein J6Q65_04955 [Lentisphaeria bacterium]|nr:hypothetical protein [Lentisphaeria bacterium]